MRNVVPRGQDARYGAWAVVIGGLAVALVYLVFPDTLVGRPSVSQTQLSWLMLAALFAVTEDYVLRVRMARCSLWISFGAIPLVLGLFVVGPGALLAGRALGVLTSIVVRRRHTPARSALQLALALGGTALSVLAFHGLLGDRNPTSWLGYALALLATVLAAVLETYVPLRLQAGHESLRGGHRRVLLAQAASNAAALGLVATVVLAHDLGLRPLTFLAATFLVAYRAFAKLNQRHASLERLYVLSDSLAAAPNSVDVVRSVLQQSATLLRADYAEVMLAGVGQGIQLWSVRPDGGVYGPVEPGAHHRTLPFPPAEPRVVRGSTRDEREFLLARGLREAAVVPLRVDGPVTGQLLVGDRVGEEDGFAVADLRLLETVANHAGVALRNSRLIDQLHFEARHDELTGLPNRLFFRGLLDEATDALNRGVPCVVMMLDFNGFKAINDSLGHAAGDQLLQVLARRFHQAMAGRATVARLGGDEFAVLAAGIEGRTAATELADRLLAAFEEPVEIGTTRLRVGGSLGIALGPSHGRTGAELMRMADVAMYVAKSGTGGARVYSPEFAPQSSEVLTLATDLRDALRNDEIEIVVQPLVRLDTLAVHSLEALARWRHPVLGEITPAEFFAAAERSGLTAALSERVLDCALAACRSWSEAGHDLRISVNMATRWLNNAALPSQIAEALRRHRVPADLLCLEITESSVMDDPRRCSEVLAELRSTGVHVSVDDFGTGYSSLTYLSRLPVDQIKIDESFTRLVTTSDRDRAVVRSIVDLGRNLGMEVVAEGIGDAATRKILAGLGCQFGQGYLFARPIETAEVPALLERIRTVGWPMAQREAPVSEAMSEALSLLSPVPASQLPVPAAGVPAGGVPAGGVPAGGTRLDKVPAWPNPQQQPSRRI